jgi:hypothetical protein
LHAIHPWPGIIPVCFFQSKVAAYGGDNRVGLGYWLLIFSLICQVAAKKTKKKLASNALECKLVSVRKCCEHEQRRKRCK